MKSVMGLLLGLAALVPAVSFATDSTAEQILAKVSQTYCGLRSFRFVEQQESQPAVSTSHIQTAQDLPAPFGTRPARCETDLAVSTPGRMRLAVSSGQAEILLFSDGRETWAYIPNLNEYVEATAAPLLQELWAHPIGFISDNLALYRSLTHEHGHAKLRGEETLSLAGQKVQC
jgi:outer membrane lipoprotein-sorting protein